MLCAGKKEYRSIGTAIVVSAWVLLSILVFLYAVLPALPAQAHECAMPRWSLTLRSIERTDEGEPSLESSQREESIWGVDGHYHQFETDRAELDVYPDTAGPGSLELELEK